MIKLLTDEQRLYLKKPQPKKETPGNIWTNWNQQIKDIGRDITAVTMATLLEEEKAYRESDGKEKSKQGAKFTQTVVAVDGRISKIRSARLSASKVVGIQPITAFGTEASGGRATVLAKRQLPHPAEDTAPESNGPFKKAKIMKVAARSAVRKNLKAFFKVTPIIWHLKAPSNSLTALLYLTSFNPQTLE